MDVFPELLKNDVFPALENVGFFSELLENILFSELNIEFFEFLGHMNFFVIFQKEYVLS